MSQQITIPGPGDTLAERYVILEELGRGSYGVVFKAHEVANPQRLVAIKTLLPQSVLDQEVIDRFEREAQLVTMLDHPNIIGIHDYGQRDNLFYMVMEFIEGPSLDDLLEHEAPVSTERARHIMAQVMEALAHAHQKGIVHRDLKPDNILIQKDNQGRELVKILDFGIAKAMRDENQDMKTLTQAGHVLGTPHYMSPEQISGDDIDHRADIYATGVILYELLVGEHPFEGTSPTAVMVAHLRDDPPALPAPLENSKWGLLVRESLRKQPDDRLSSASQFLALLNSEHDRIDADESNEVTALFPSSQPPQDGLAETREYRPLSTHSLHNLTPKHQSDELSADATIQWTRVEPNPAGSNFGAEPVSTRSPRLTAPTVPPIADPAHTWDTQQPAPTQAQSSSNALKVGVVAILLLGLLGAVFVVLSTQEQDDTTHEQKTSTSLTTSSQDTQNTSVLPATKDLGSPQDLGAPTDSTPDLNQDVADLSEPDMPPDMNEPSATQESKTTTKKQPPAHVTLRLKSVPNGATIKINHKYIGETDLTHKLKQGDKTVLIEVSRLGYKSESRRVKLDKSRTITFKLESGLITP